MTTLTPRELDVLRHMVDGLQNKEIAGALGVSYNTVRTHLHHAFLKLGAVNRAEAAAIAVRRQLA